MQRNPAVELPIADVPITVAPGWRQPLGRVLMIVASMLAVAFLAIQLLKTFGFITFGFENWRPVAVAFLGWSICLCVSLVLTRGQRGEQAVFLLPAVLLTLAFVIFPTIYALFIAFHNWNLSAAAGRQFTGLDNFRRMFADRAFWVAMQNMAYYVAAVLAQYVIAFGLAIL
jgi:multiple sugar transport system permease protein